MAVIVAVATTGALLLRSRRALYVRFAVFASSIAGYYLASLLVNVLGVTTVLASARIIAGGVVAATATIFFDATLGEAGLDARARQRKTFLAAAAIVIGALTPLARYDWALWLGAGSILVLLGWRAIAILQRAKEVESAAEANAPSLPGVGRRARALVAHRRLRPVRRARSAAGLRSRRQHLSLLHFANVAAIAAPRSTRALGQSPRLRHARVDPRRRLRRPSSSGSANGAVCSSSTPSSRVR